MKFLVLLVFLLGCNYSTLGEIHENTKIPEKDYVIIDSNGGDIYHAFDIGGEFKDKTCIVKKARSAALQVILPFCKERYYLPDAVIQFHSAGLSPKDLAKEGEFELLTEPLLMVILESIQYSNVIMTMHMIESGIPLTMEQIYIGLMKNTTISGLSLKILHPWMLPISECSHCPK